jgi:NAD(P)-dependent dehydrogenase (short-subunit alcohol dehydrogenase family)
VATGVAHSDRSQVAVWLDVTDGSSIERAFADAACALGGIDALINVAGGDTYHGVIHNSASLKQPAVVGFGRF